MDITTLTSKIDAFRALSTEAAITPEVLGALLQSMADALGTAALQKDLNDTNAAYKSATYTNATAIAALQDWRKALVASPTALRGFHLGEVNKVSVAFSATHLMLTTGATRDVANSFALPSATVDTAGVMTAAQVQQLNKYYDHVCDMDKDITALSLKVPANLAYASATRVLSRLCQNRRSLFS